jgi:hypothetical protein
MMSARTLAAILIRPHIRFQNSEVLLSLVALVV